MENAVHGLVYPHILRCNYNLYSNQVHYAADGTAHIKVIPAYHHQSYTTRVYQNNI